MHTQRERLDRIRYLDLCCFRLIGSLALAQDEIDRLRHPTSTGIDVSGGATCTQTVPKKTSG